MKWVKFKVKTITEAEDIIISTLYDIGLEGAQIEDKVPLTALEKEQMFVDILPDGPDDDGIAYLSFFVEEKEDGSLEVQGQPTDKESILAQVKQELEDLRMFMDIGEGTVTVDETEDIDWINNWKQYFHQFYIDDILVIPSWEDVKPEDDDKMVLHIDPGTAFGTGMHETTQLCIRQLRKHITKDTELLDVGTGSGILAILSLMFGAKHAVGTDLDICAVDAVAQNCETNGIDSKRFEMMIGNIITDKAVQDKVGYECYDIVVANILADVLVPLTPVIVNQLKKGGIYITSGIIDDKEQTVVDAVRAAGLEVLEVTYQGEWVSVTARKN
ncbi:MAG: 50S ribosomal protein L11 methyltransferase [Acetatifactor sp.]|nr:50S ribosomal protein L11 methyltransferase [Acetatifactor sp.]